jgi:hypothetical protein
LDAAGHMVLFTFMEERSESNSNHRTLTNTEEGIRYLSGNAVLTIAGITTVVMPMASQSPAQKPSFEVASVKPSTSGKNRVAIIEQPGGRFVATNVSLTMLMDTAYRVRAFQILGGPNWIGTDRWNIEAKADEGSIHLLPDNQIPLRLIP